MLNLVVNSVDIRLFLACIVCTVALVTLPLAIAIDYHFRQLWRKNAEIEARIMAKLDNLTANVTENSSAVASAVTLLGNLKSELDAAIAADDDGVALQALSDTLGASTRSLAAAVVANTPAAASGAADGATSSAHPDNAPPPATQPDPAGPVGGAPGA